MKRIASLQGTCGALASLLMAAVPGRAEAIDVGEILRGQIGIQSAAEVRRAMQDQRAAEANQRQLADADACAKLKSWLASAPAAAGARRAEDWMPLLEDERFSRAFGKTYDRLTIADFRELQTAQQACQRTGALTPAEAQTAQTLLNPSLQPQLSVQLAATRARRGEREALLAELDGLPATDSGLQRLDAIAAKLAQQQGVSAEDGRAAQLRLDAARTRVALPVHTARIQRLAAEARGADGIAALAAAADDLNRAGLGAQADPLKKQASDRIDELAEPLLREERAAVGTWPTGLPGLEKGVPYLNGFTARYQKAIAAVPPLARFRAELLAQRASAITAATPELSSELQKARSEAEVGTVLARYLLDEERQQAGRALTRVAAERVASLRQAGENQRVFASAAEPAGGANSASPTGTVPHPNDAKDAKDTRSAKDSKVLADASELRKYEAGTIVHAIYHADLAGLRDDTLFTRKYLIAQAGHLGENCDTFKVTEVRAYETRLQQQVVTAAQQNMGQILRNSLNLYVQAQKNPSTIVDAGAAQQRIEDAPEFAVRDVERLAKTYGGCDSAVIGRYTRNLRSYLEKAR